MQFRKVRSAEPGLYLTYKELKQILFNIDTRRENGLYLTYKELKRHQ